VALDIGANIGAFTLPLARAVGKGGHVISFEATAFAYAKLMRNLALNPELQSRVTARQAVLGEGLPSGEKATAIYSSWRIDGTSNPTDHPLHGGRPMSTEGAIAASLDEVLNSNASLRSKLAQMKFVKLDVDGHELPILRGARETLAAARPMLLIEIAPHVQDEREGGLPALVDELERQGYRLHDPIAGKVVSHKPADLRSMIPHGAGVDLLAVRPQ
jgi:FkbM family methyltransferase